MKRAAYSDKSRVVQILTESFRDNKSVNYIIKQDKHRIERLTNLIGYSFGLCYLFGDIFLSDDNSACALIMRPDKKKTTLKTIGLDIKLIFSSIGFSNASKAMRREAAIKKHHPCGPLYYLWFIGVASSKQHKGTGSRLMNEIVAEANNQKRIICLETSTLQNIPWYQKFGFTIYKELDFGYRLYCLKRDVPK